MKQLLPLLPLFLAIAILPGCSDSVATPVPAPAQVATNPGTANSPGVVQVPDEKKSESAPESQQPNTVAPTETATSPSSESAATATEATPSAEPVRSRPPARSSEIHKISFDDLNCSMQADIVFRPWMLTERVKELDGQRIRISGYMNPDVKRQGITEFILLRNTECKFGPTGQADHLIRVKLNPGVTTSFSSKPVQVVGTLIVNPFEGPDGKTWAIFDMTGESVGTPQR